MKRKGNIYKVIVRSKGNNKIIYSKVTYVNSFDSVIDRIYKSLPYYIGRQDLTFEFTNINVKGK